MEKISKILAPSARTQSYDSSRAQPGRPGAPSLGRPIYEPIIDRVSFSEDLVDSMNAQYNKPVAQIKAQKIKEMSEKFFLGDQVPKEIPKEVIESSVMPDSSSELSL